MGSCGAENVAVSPPRLWRNGLDYEPKRVGPPDYSNVPDIRSWQMSPFAKERFDLDEIQKAEKKGYKFKAEVERLKRLYGGEPKEDAAGEKAEDECEKCAKRKREEMLGKALSMKCTFDYVYQPYGPSIVSSLSYSRPESTKPRMYTYLGPSILSGFRSSKAMESPVPCETLEAKRKPQRDFGRLYIPYGPFGEIRITKDQYVPMGPTPVGPFG